MSTLQIRDGAGNTKYLEGIGAGTVGDPFYPQHMSRNFYLDVARGSVTGVSIVNKIGYNPAVGTSFVPVATAGVYQTPTADTSLELLSSDANDTSAGTGARTVLVEGINLAGTELAETVTMNGVTPVVLSNSFFRVYKVSVATSGTYASASAGSHAGTIILRASGGGATWATIAVEAGFALGQSQIGVYTVPSGKQGYILQLSVSIESNKAVDVHLFKRNGANTVSAPYTPMTLIEEFQGLTGSIVFPYVAPVDSLSAFTDVGFMAKVATGTAAVEVNFQLLLMDI